MSSGFGDAYGVVDTVQKRMDDALVVAEEKSGMKNMYHTSIKWLFNRMIATTFEFAVMSLVISYCIACGVIMLVTGNWKVTIISAYVLLSIISFSLMGLVVCGYDMSLNECCVILVAAGMSVDYLLHMSHSFNHSQGSKEERVRQSLKEMGISVLSGAITTMSAAISLCFCVFYIYSRPWSIFTLAYRLRICLQCHRFDCITGRIWSKFWRGVNSMDRQDCTCLCQASRIRRARIKHQLSK